jgi:hypothetical protein
MIYEKQLCIFFLILEVIFKKNYLVINWLNMIYLLISKVEAIDFF